MSTIRYEAPTTLDQAVRLFSANANASLLAGGTDLLVQFRAGLTQPSTFIDLKRIPDLTGITLDGSGLRLGAAVPAWDICRHQDVKRLWPGFVDAVGLIGSAQIQGRATVGGNLCNASPAADTIAALIVDRGQCVIVGPDGERTVTVEEFCAGPGLTVLRPGELLVAVRLPRPAPRTADAYLRLIPRSEMDIAVAGAAVSLTLDARGVCSAARVAIAAVAPKALLVAAAAEALVGSSVDEQALDRAAAASSSAARPIDDKRGTAAYRRTVAGVLTRRAATIAAARAKDR
jgi:carbon-monoxide dehydrogenase medium subunit